MPIQDDVRMISWVENVAHETRAETKNMIEDLIKVSRQIIDEQTGQPLECRGYSDAEISSYFEGYKYHIPLAYKKLLRFCGKYGFFKCPVYQSALKLIK